MHHIRCGFVVSAEEIERLGVVVESMSGSGMRSPHEEGSIVDVSGLIVKLYQPVEETKLPIGRVHIYQC